MTLEELKQAVADPKTDTQSKVVGEYVLQKCSGSQDFAAKVQQKGHTLERCVKYIFYQAAQMNKKHQAMMMFGQDEVFGWVDAYFDLDSKKEEAEVKAAEKLMSELRMFNQNTAKNDQKGKPADIKVPQKPNPEKHKKDTPDSVPEKVVAEKEHKPEKIQDQGPKAEKEKKKPGMEGQFSLFDLM